MSSMFILLLLISFYSFNAFIILYYYTTYIIYNCNIIFNINYIIINKINIRMSRVSFQCNGTDVDK